MDDKLYDILMKLPKANIINLMEGSLDYMQGYNGRSRQTCILEALGADEYENEEGKISWKLPTQKEMKKYTGYRHL